MTLSFIEFLEERTKIRVFDFDDTLVHTDGVVRVTNKGKTRELTPAEYALYTPQRGDVFDFDDFENVVNPRPVGWIHKILQGLKRAGSEAEILTARANYAPIKAYLKSHGIHDVYVNALGSGNPQEKAKHIERLIQKGYDFIEFFDDSPLNIKAVASLSSKYPDVRIRARKVG